jgi:hypothetical protein
VYKPPIMFDGTLPVRIPAENAEDPIKTALDQSLQKLGELTWKKITLNMQMAAVDQEIAKLRPKIIGLAALSDEPPKDELFDLFIQETAGKGLTDSIKDALMGADDFMTPIQVRDALIRTGYEITGKYANPLAVIHNLLKRLAASKKLITRTAGSGTEYKWNPNPPLTRRQARLLKERRPEWFKHMIGKREPNYFQKLAEELAEQEAKATKARDDFTSVTLPITYNPPKKKG